MLTTRGLAGTATLTGSGSTLLKEMLVLTMETALLGTVTNSWVGAFHSAVSMKIRATTRTNATALTITSAHPSSAMATPASPLPPRTTVSTATSTVTAETSASAITLCTNANQSAEFLAAPVQRMTSATQNPAKAGTALMGMWLRTPTSFPSLLLCSSCLWESALLESSV